MDIFLDSTKVHKNKPQYEIVPVFIKKGISYKYYISLYGFGPIARILSTNELNISGILWYSSIESV